MKGIKTVITGLKTNQFIKVSLFSSMSALVKIGTAFIISKIIAISLGPKGLGLIGQLSSFISVMLVFAGGTINNGVVKYVAEYNSFKVEKLQLLLSTAFRIVIYSGVICGILLSIFSRQISQFVLQSDDYHTVIIVFGFTILFYGLNNFLLAILNGFKEFEKFNKINIYGSLIGLLLSIFFIYTFNVFGALISLVCNQSIIFIFTLYMLRKERWMTKETFGGTFNEEEGAKLLKFASLAIVSAALVPASQFMVRKYILMHLGYDEAGYWELITRISTYSLLFFSLSISTYYLPRISELKTQSAIKNEVLNAYKILIPVTLVTLTVLYLGRDVLIRMLASPDFSQSSNLFRFQLIGDFFKICSWVLGYLMVGRGLIKLSLFTEVMYNVLFVILSVLGVHYYGLIGVTYAYSLNYLVYLLVMVFLFRKLIYKSY